MEASNTQALAMGRQPTINRQEIDMGALISEWRLSSSYVEQYTRDFPSLDQLVDGVPLNQDPNSPFVGDTTMAGLVRKMPRDSLQQLPVFSVTVNGTEHSLPALLCTYLLRTTAFNEDTFGKGLLATLQIGAEQALTHGYAPFMVATGSMYNDFGTTMRLLHFSDTSPEPGITDANQSAYHYVVANLTESRVKKIIKAAERNPSTTWDIEALKLVLAATPRATDYSKYASDPRRNAAGESAGPTYQFVTRYETGQGGTVITFCPEVTEMPLRTFESKSKWGYPRVQYLVIDPAALTPFGISRVRLASPNQNLMNIFYGNIASMLLLNSKPPILKRGRFTTPVQLKQGVVWETLDQNAKAELVSLDNGALAQFVPFAQQFAAQIQNIMGSPQGNTNGNSSAMGYSKTAPGVKQQIADQDLSVNQITKILENFLRQYALVALDTLLSEQEGVDMVTVDDETKNAINKLVPGAVGEDNKIQMNWEEFYAAIEQWSVKVTVSLSKDEMDEKKRGDLQDMMVVLAQNADKLGPEAGQRLQEIINQLMEDKAPLTKPLSEQVAPAQTALPAPGPEMAPPIQ